jgi:hypothetical protein
VRFPRGVENFVDYCWAKVWTFFDINSIFVLKSVKSIISNNMSKKIIAVAAAALAFAFGAKAQTNFQTFYDFSRKHFTTTLEGYYGDKWGDTFFFIDYDYNAKNEKNISLEFPAATSRLHVDSTSGRTAH